MQQVIVLMPSERILIGSGGSCFFILLGYTGCSGFSFEARSLKVPVSNMVRSTGKAGTIDAGRGQPLLKGIQYSRSLFYSNRNKRKSLSNTSVERPKFERKPCAENNDITGVEGNKYIRHTGHRGHEHSVYVLALSKYKAHSQGIIEVTGQL